MGQPAAPVRAVARVEARRPVGSTPAPLVLRRDPSAGGRALLRVMLVQAVALGALALPATGARPWAVAVLAALAVVTAVALVRRRNRWWTEHLGIAWRHRHRRRAPDAPRLALHLLVPELQVTDLSTTEGGSVGVARDATGWYAVAVLASDRPVPLSRLARTLASAEEAAASVQVVVHTEPAPALDLDTKQPAAASYRALLDALGAVPATRTRWVAVRIDEPTLVEAAADGDADRTPYAPELAAALIRRSARALDRAGLPCRILDAAGLIDALGHSLDLAVPVGPDLAVREGWRAWHSDRLAHASFWVRGWNTSGDLLDRLGTVPGAVTSVALTLRPRAGTFDVRGVVRVATRPADLRSACAALLATARGCGARLFRLDGEQAPAAYASAPTGGGAR